MIPLLVISARGALAAGEAAGSALAYTGRLLWGKAFLDGTYQNFLDQELRVAGQNAQARLDAAGSLSTSDLLMQGA